jgi:hypothetical protein
LSRADKVVDVLQAPWLLSANDPSASSEQETPPDHQGSTFAPANDNPQTPGRPENPLWDYIGKEARRIRRGDSDMLNKCLAGKVRDMAISEFPVNDVPALATIQKKLKHLGASKYGT